MTRGLGGNAGPFRFPCIAVDHAARCENPARMLARVSLRALAALAAVGATTACAPHARPIESPYRASVAAFYMGAPRSDAAGGARADVAFERWVDDRVLVGVDAEYASFARAKPRTESMTGAGVRASYVLCRS